MYLLGEMIRPGTFVSGMSPIVPKTSWGFTATKILYHGLPSAATTTNTTTGKKCRRSLLATQALPVGAIIFPQVVPNRETHLRTLSKAVTLARLVSINGMLRKPDLMKRELLIWRRMLEQGSAYELVSGKGIENLPALMVSCFA